MSQYNPTDAIFFGFRLFKRDPLMVLAFVAVTALTAVLSMQIAWQELVALSSVANSASGGSNPEAAMEEVRAAYGVFLSSPDIWVTIIASLLLSLIIQGASLRGLLFDRRQGWVVGMQLGADELRLFVIDIVLFLLLFVVMFGVTFVATFAVAILAAVSPLLGGLGGVAAVVASILAIGLFATRLCAAGPATVGEGKLVLFGSWAITRGRMWGLLGAFVVLFFIVLVGQLMVFALTSFLAPQATALMNGAISIDSLDDPASAFRSPGYLLVVVLNSVVNVGATIAWTGVGAYAYRMLGGAAGYAHASPPDDLPPPPVMPS